MKDDMIELGSRPPTPPQLLTEGLRSRLLPVLRDGWHVVAIKCDANYGIVLAWHEACRAHRWATWQYNVFAGGIEGPYLGHYFSNRDEAIMDFDQRIPDGR